MPRPLPEDPGSALVGGGLSMAFSISESVTTGLPYRTRLTLWTFSISLLPAPVLFIFCSRSGVSGSSGNKCGFSSPGLGGFTGVLLGKHELSACCMQSSAEHIPPAPGFAALQGARHPPLVASVGHTPQGREGPGRWPGQQLLLVRNPVYCSRRVASYLLQGQRPS